MNNPVYIYISPYDILRPRTNQLSDVRFCDGIAINNREIHLIAPFVKRNDNLTLSQIPEIYGTTGKTKIHILNTEFIEDVSGKTALFQIMLKAYKEISLIKKSYSKKTKFVVISRNLPLVLPFLILQKMFFWPKSFFSIHWAHDFKLNRFNKIGYKFCSHLLATNSSITEDFCSVFKVNINKTLVTSNPITQQQADEIVNKIESKKLTGLDKYPQKLVVYTGKLTLNFNKEIYYILESAKSNREVLFVFTGGKPEAVNYWKTHCNNNSISNYLFTGYITDYNLIKHYQRSADILISYYTNDGHDTRYNLPNKICEYMLSGNPIITPNFKATKDLLTDENCFFVKDEAPIELSAKIKTVLENPNNASIIANKSLNDVRQNTFTKNTKKVIQFTEHLLNK